MVGAGVGYRRAASSESAQTATGMLLSPVLLSPSCPKLFRPQHNAS